MLLGVFWMMTSAAIIAQAGENPIVSRHVALFERPPQHVPTQGMADGPLLGNGDVGVVLAGPPEAQQLLISKNDFWRRNDASIMAVGGVNLVIPALHGASYRQEQDMAHGEVRGIFSKDLLTLRTRSWVSAEENLLVTSIHCEGGTPVSVTVRLVAGPHAGGLARLVDNDRLINVGREQYGKARWYFNGWIEGVRIEPTALSADEILAMVRQRRIGQAPKRFDGESTFEELQVPRMKKAVTVAA